MALPQENASPYRPPASSSLRQFVKFAIVGASSTVITFAVLNLMLNVLHGHRFVSATIAFFVAVGNGYFWNRRWTFKSAAQKAAHTQFAQFLAVNLVGLALTNLIQFLIATPMEHHIQQWKPSMPFAQVYKLATNLAQVVAIPIVVFWNFFANRHWTFRH